ncbi:ferredoxin [Parafrankia discariae]|uniref:ferredoxin n=1 Tax=Parafrankia discariae TaxID=365528 RepID=UPI0003795A7A|nr:ferredoxin [Parafrankia discariae]
MRIEVDPDRCEGHARCWDISPGVFELDEQGHGTVILSEIPAELAEQAADAARNCPERAITISD